MKIKCLGCGKIVDVPNNYDRQATCSNCNSNFTELNQVPSISTSLDQIGNQFQQIRQNIPHITIGKQGINTNTPIQQNNPNLKYL